MTQAPSQPAPWQRAVAGAGLLGADGSVRQTIFAEMSALAHQTGAINLGQGFPDTDGPPELLEAARRAISEGHNQYPPGAGLPVLRQAIADHQRRFHGLDVDPERGVAVTAGATEALAAALLALVRPGDEVVCFEPTYDAYAAIVALAQGVLRTVPLRFSTGASRGWQADPEDLRRAFSDGTRVVLVNSPHNPTGTVIDAELSALIVELATRHDAVIVTDEVYEHLLHPAPAGTPSEGPDVGRPRHRPIASLPGAFDRTLSISSAGKTFSVTGWKIGWVSGPRALVDAVLAVKQYLSFTGGAPFQPAVAQALGSSDAVYASIADQLTARRDLLCAALDRVGFEVSVPQAGYFTVVDVKPLGVDDADEFCRRLPELAGVVAVPVTAFVQPERRREVVSLVRFAFCKRVEVLNEAAERLLSLAPESPPR